MRAIQSAALSIFAFILSACPHPELTRRYEEIEFSPKDFGQLNPTASIAVFTLPIPETPASTTIASLSDRAQAEAVKALAAREQPTNKFLSALATPIAAPPSPSAFVDRTKVKRRVVVSLENNSPGRADRIGEATVILRPGSEARFVSWDKFITNHENVDLGKMTFEQKSGLTAGVNLLAPGINEIADASVEGSLERNLTEEISLRQRIVVSTGSISPEEAKFYQQGAVGIDLTGNIIIDAIIDLTNDSIPLQTHTFLELFQQDGKPKPPGDVRVRTQRVVYPKTAKLPVMMKATLEYLVRHVQEGDESVAEGDDEVRYVRGILNEPIESVLVPVEEMRFVAWGLAAGNNFVAVQEPASQRPGVMAFSNYDEALQLLTWIERVYGQSGENQRLTVAGRDLLLGNRPLLSSAVRGLDVAILTQNF